ncbi:hypothetical protein EYF80_011649 [Liparis tanakae]|uniref:Uncharacterized protein n=1 Tax=Liparis tanakae TaxID=230148 RepID=A0A4Z2IKY8_9TELE|nr:hypothetical protein EYF80_011649 [Liparis tanakae]
MTQQKTPKGDGSKTREDGEFENNERITRPEHPPAMLRETGRLLWAGFTWADGQRLDSYLHWEDAPGRKSLNQEISGSGMPLAAHSMVAVLVLSTTFSWGPMSILGKPNGNRSSGRMNRKKESV